MRMLHQQVKFTFAIGITIVFENYRLHLQRLLHPSHQRTHGLLVNPRGNHPANQADNRQNLLPPNHRVNHPPNPLLSQQLILPVNHLRNLHPSQRVTQHANPQQYWNHLANHLVCHQLSLQ